MPFNRLSLPCLLLALIASLFIHAAQAGGKIPKAVTEAYLRAEKEILHLEQSSFQTKIQKGNWMIFYGATWCGHCQKFTPTWLELQKKVETDFKDSNFHVGKVECTLNADLCEQIAGFPTVYYYQDGKRVGDEVVDQELPDLLKFVKSHAWDKSGQPGLANLKDAELNAGKPNIALDQSPMEVLHAYAEQEIHPGADVNPTGLVTHMTRGTFASLTAERSWFVMFHAPWCGHCKTLAPIWDQVAEELKGQVDIGKVNCDEEKDLMKRFNIKGFPTLVLINEPNAPIVYKGSRRLEDIKKFVLDSITRPSFLPVTAKEIPDIISKEEVAFYFAYDANVTDYIPFRMFQSVAKTVKPFAKLYVSPEVQAFKILHAEEGKPVLIAVRDGGLDSSVYPGEFAGDGSTRTMLREWIMQERFPLVTKLDTATQADILESNRFVALALVNPDTPDGKGALDHFKNSAKHWKNIAAAEKRNRVKFAWIDAKMYADYVFSVYSVKPMDLPVFIIANPAMEQYYNEFADGKKYDSFAHVVVHDSINEVLDGKGKAKTNQGTFSRSAKWVNRQFVRTVSIFVTNNIIVTVLIMGGCIMSLTYYAMNRKGGYQSVSSISKQE
ncbi:hypothetical protein BATDEDRAFT_26166 [Batrachochytrium dendrobatidis JAM81]|uniref:Thioredoxin domain-containing protein n=1 Tax=Batrachochytrium dendrobatidis (strain JAM81 / FGSC 10211) TaxID=684364 RepID=F4P6P0_BATDJ|nr:uncharacterized protein BATDEDRAFT_26166 [Batrachochytrium dendrobatidis JAM81]EGF79017.1 hypothetical protein BATDEDRAFT_26166 [Batrachochytrium dendrobatidis JAM81]|eukprot:XP_006680331.1 hypothetical protein BATDEDRAFT_26166 [Batrachochytrium dendrobatidis JAM81]